MMNNILIVDDVSVNRKLISKILSKRMKDINIIEAESGHEALALLSKVNISVIILDIVMPDMDGLEVLEKIKADTQFANIPVIMCSAANEMENVDKALSLGALDFFTKNLTEEQRRITLPMKVQNALEYYRQKKDLEKYYIRMKEEMQFAEQLQKSMISESADFNYAKMYGKYIPSGDIGGDLFLCKAVNGRLWFLIADVIGHGVAAAMVSAMLNVLFNAAINTSRTPSAALCSINNSLFDIFNGSEQGIISAFVGCYESNKLQYSNAGHPYPVLFKKTQNTIEQLNVNGFLLGAFKDADYEDNTVELSFGDLLIVYTDGLFDNGKNGKFAAWNSVADFCRLNKELFIGDMKVLIDKIIRHFLELNTDSHCFKDDAAVMAIRFV